MDKPSVEVHVVSIVVNASDCIQSPSTGLDNNIFSPLLHDDDELEIADLVIAIGVLSTRRRERSDRLLFLKSLPPDWGAINKMRSVAGGSLTSPS